MADASTRKVALATSLVALINFVALVWFMRRKIKRLNGRVIAASFFKIAAASAVMSAVCYASYYFLYGYLGPKTIVYKGIEAFVPILLGALVFIGVAKLLRVTELEQAFGAIRRKLAR